MTYCEEYKLDDVILLWCEECKTNYDEKNIELINLKENDFGEDIATFKCPKCNVVRESLRWLGKRSKK